MKTLCLVLISLLLSSCGPNPEVKEPIVPPTVVGGAAKTVRYPVSLKPRYCTLTIISGGTPLPYNSYNYECEYDSSNSYVKAFLVTYYYSLPSLAYLSYPLY